MEDFPKSMIAHLSCESGLCARYRVQLLIFGDQLEILIQLKAR